MKATLSALLLGAAVAAAAEVVTLPHPALIAGRSTPLLTRPAFPPMRILRIAESFRFPSRGKATRLAPAPEMVVVVQW